MRFSSMARLGTGGIAVAATLVFVSAAGAEDTKADDKEPCDLSQGSESYSVKELKGGSESSVEAISPDGDYMVGGVSEDKLLTVWHDGKYTEIEAPSWATDLYVEDVNNDGVVAGTIKGKDKDDEVSRGFRYIDGKFQVLTAPDDKAPVFASTVNASGTVAGYYGIPGEKYYSVVWQPGETDATVMKVSSDMQRAEGADISDDGVVVGDVTTPWDPETYSEQSYGWMWDSQTGEGTKLPVVGDGKDYKGTIINGDWVTIWDTSYVSGSDTYRWNLNGDEKPEKVGIGTVYDMDENGRVYGSDGMAALWDSGKPVRLDGLLETPPEDPDDGGYLYSYEVYSATADGRTLLGTADGKNVVWECTT